MAPYWMTSSDYTILITCIGGFKIDIYIRDMTNNVYHGELFANARDLNKFKYAQNTLALSYEKWWKNRTCGDGKRQYPWIINTNSGYISIPGETPESLAVLVGIKKLGGFPAAVFQKTEEVEVAMSMLQLKQMRRKIC